MESMIYRSSRVFNNTLRGEFVFRGESQEHEYFVTILFEIKFKLVNL